MSGVGSVSFLGILSGVEGIVCIFLSGINGDSCSANVITTFYDFYVLFFPSRLSSDSDYVKVEERYHLGLFKSKYLQVKDRKGREVLIVKMYVIQVAPLTGKARCISVSLYPLGNWPLESSKPFASEE